MASEAPQKLPSPSNGSLKNRMSRMHSSTIARAFWKRVGIKKLDLEFCCVEVLELIFAIIDNLTI